VANRRERAFVEKDEDQRQIVSRSGRRWTPLVR
jgi:ATP-dependent DNA ligase